MTADRTADRTRLPAPRAVARPPAGDVTLLVLALCAVSASGPLIAATAAPALAIAFWRNAMASGVLVPTVLVRFRDELGGLSRREWSLAVLAGLLLAAHFATWVPSLSYTSVASATALVATQPIWAGLIARIAGHEVPRAAWLGIGVAVLGTALLTGVDLRASHTALVGDSLALVGGACAALYMSAGSAVRRSVSTTTYTTICYTTAALVLLVACLLAGLRLGGYSGTTWVQLAALTVGPQLLGHSVFNRVLRTTSATVVSLSILFEVPAAAVIAAIFLDQQPPVLAVPAVGLLIAGVALVIRSGERGTAPAVPVE